MPKNKLQKAEHKKNNSEYKQIPKFVYILTIILVIVTIFALMPQFRIQQVEFKDFLFISPEEVYMASGITQNQFFLKGIGGSLNEYLAGRYTGAEQRVKNTFPEVDTIKIYFDFPSKVVFEMKEKIEIGWIKIQDGFCTVDSNGKVISILQEQPEALPIISGLTVLNATIGKKIEVSQADYLENAMYVMSSLIEADVDVEGKKLLTMVKRIEPTINNDIYLILENGEKNFTIICDKSHDLTDDFLWLKKAMNSDVLASEKSGIIDVRGKNRIFRKNRPVSDADNANKQEQDSQNVSDIVENDVAQDEAPDIAENDVAQGETPDIAENDVAQGEAPDIVENNLEQGEILEDMQGAEIENPQDIPQVLPDLEQEP